jgi:hypothetical protein
MELVAMRSLAHRDAPPLNKITVSGVSIPRSKREHCCSRTLGTIRVALV